MTVWAVVAANLALFIGVTSLPTFQGLHHHWIFPALACLLTVEWLATAALGNSERARAVRATVLSVFAFLILMGIVRHYSILTCFGVCSLKLGAAAAVAAAVFALQAQREEEGFWGVERSHAAVLALCLWAAYLFMFGRGVDPAKLDVLFGVAGVLLTAIGWGTPSVWIVSLGTLCVLLLRRIGGEHAIIFVDVPLALAGLWLAGALRKPAV